MESGGKPLQIFYLSTNLELSGQLDVLVTFMPEETNWSIFAHF